MWFWCLDRDRFYGSSRAFSGASANCCVLRGRDIGTNSHDVCCQLRILSIMQIKMTTVSGRMFKRRDTLFMLPRHLLMCMGWGGQDFSDKTTDWADPSIQDPAELRSSGKKVGWNSKRVPFWTFSYVQVIMCYRRGALVQAIKILVYCANVPRTAVVDPIWRFTVRYGSVIIRSRFERYIPMPTYRL